MVLCPAYVDWCRTIAEIALTLAAFRLFLAAGLVKSRRGSPCWKDGTCLYDHWETQPMPNPLAWYMHRLLPEPVKVLFQRFAIDFAEQTVPYFFLSFVLTTGPLGLLHRRLRESERWYVRWPFTFPGRAATGIVVICFVLGMFTTGNYAFLHPLSLVAVVASLGTVRGLPAECKEPSGLGAFSVVRLWYRRIVPVIVIALSVFAFLPSIRAYSWLMYDDEFHFSFSSRVEMWSITRRARRLNLGIPYNHHAYFAGAVHTRDEVVVFADVGGDDLVELDIPCKVGSVDRAPCITSPLHRRFAWEWWFIPLGSDDSWMQEFLVKLCAKDAGAWGALETNPAQGRLDQLKSVHTRMFRYHFSPKGSKDWWTRKQRRSNNDYDFDCRRVAALLEEQKLEESEESGDSGNWMA